MKRHSILFPVLLLTIAVVAAGCGLFGSMTGSQRAGKTQEKEVRSTIEALAEAGRNQELQNIAPYVSAGAVMEILNDSDEDFSQVLQGDEEIIRHLGTIFDESHINNIELDIGEIAAYDDRAEIVGSFAVDFINSSGEFIECSGYATATLTNDGGVWQVTSIAVEEAECLVDGEQPDEEDPADRDDETGDPGHDNGDWDDGDDGGLGPIGDGPPAFAFRTCEYLVEGSQGTQVEALQTSLNYLGYNAGLIDGDFGPMTKAAVEAFQRDAGVYVDGEFGPETNGALDATLARHNGSYYCETSETKPTSSSQLTMSALRKGTAFETPVYIYDAHVSGPTIVFVGCIHGNERSGHLTLVDMIERGISIDRGRLILVPAINKIACEQNRRTLSRSTSILSGKDFNRFFPVGKTPTYTIAKEMWSLLQRQPNLSFVVDFHDGFINSLGNTLIHTRQSKAQSVARKIRDSLNRIRPRGSRGPTWRAFTEPISGSLIRKVGRDMKVPGILVELSGRNPGDPLSLRKQYAERIIQMVGAEFGMTIRF